MNTDNLSLKEIVKNNIVTFSHYRDGNLYYTVVIQNPQEEFSILNNIYQFPVPTDDIGNATLLSQDKAIIMMRYIRKALEDGTFVKKLIDEKTN